jgi:type VI secretion system protein ImpH
MPAPQWHHPAALISRLADQPQHFHFFQAVRIIDLWLRRDGNAHGYTLERVLRCKNSVTLAFPCSQIEQLTFDASAPLDNHAAWRGALAGRQLHHIHVTPAFMGLLGIHGVLPYRYTDTIAAQIHFDKNAGGRAFFDTFTHRSVILFYRAWEKCHVEFRRGPDGTDDFLRLQLALAAARPGRRQWIPDEVLAHYAALFRHRNVSGEALVGVLSEYFGLSFQLRPFIGAWIAHPVAQQSQLGQFNCRLGENTLLGARYRRRDLCVRLRIGPLARSDAEHFLEHGPGYQALKAMLSLFAVTNLRFEVRVVLQADDVRRARLDGHTALGRDAFILGAPSARDRDDICYHLTF